MWYEKIDGVWFLVDEQGQKIEVLSKPFPSRSRAFAAARDKAKAYMQANGIWDATAFGAGMSVMISDAVIVEHEHPKALVFATVDSVERTGLWKNDQSFRRKCMRRVEEFYSNKDYQQFITFQNPERYNDHILRPIVLVVNELGEIEDIPTHNALAKMDVIVFEDFRSTVFVDDKGQMNVERVLRHYFEENPLRRG